MQFPNFNSGTIDSPPPAGPKCTLPRAELSKAADALRRAGVRTKDSFTVATWNINRIPTSDTKTYIDPWVPAYRLDRLECMAEILATMDIAALQERFLPFRTIPHHPHMTDDVTQTPLAKLDTNAGLYNHHGLAITSARPSKKLTEGYYHQCGPNEWDCRVRKGFIISGVAVPGGTVVMVTSHMDAGRLPSDQAARESQLRELEKTLEPYRDRPLILLGDFNFTQATSEELPLLAFLKRQGLHIDARQPKKGLDMVAARGVEPMATVAYTHTQLTDHALLGITYRLQAKASSLPPR